MKKKEAIETLQGTTPNRVLCYVADYAQNMYVPNFASEQPGATYYYSPMNAYCFGVVDASIDRLTGWIYMEDQAKKGGNNVASLLMHHLHYKGIVAESAVEPFKELNLVMDNCGGQNKNRHVLRLLHLVVKWGIAKVARAIFLVHGHTKNDCDPLFNLMKKEYRRRNCFTPEDIIKSIDHERVEAVMVPVDTFKDWDALENEYMKKPAGNTKTNHIFCVDIDRDNGNTMYIQQSDGSIVEEMKLVKPQFFDADATFWKSLQPMTMDSGGLPDIKWKELYGKWGKFIPVKAKKQWRYYSEQPPQSKLQAISKQSKEAWQQRKQRVRTVHDDDEKKPLEKKPKLDDTQDNKGNMEGITRGVI